MLPWFLQPEIEDSVDIQSLILIPITRETRDEPLFKIGISQDLHILGNIWDNASLQLHEIYHTVQVIFGYLIKLLHIVPLKE